MSRMLSRLWHDDAGQDLVEYALLATLLALVSVGSLRFLGVHIRNVYTKLNAIGSL